MPDIQTAHIDTALTNISVAYIQDESNFIAEKVFPRIPVVKQSNVYFKYNKGDFFRNEMRDRAQGTESAGASYRTSIEEPYFCKKRSLHQDITEEERVNFDNPLDADQDAVIFLSQKALLERECDWAEKYFKPGVWTTEIQGVDTTEEVTEGKVLKITNPLSDPIKMFTEAGVRMASQTGFKPNKLTLSPFVYNALKNHEDILDRIKYTQKGVVTTDLLATLFEVDEVLVSWGVVNKSVVGAEDDIDFIFGNHALLSYCPKNPGLRIPSAGYIFTWKGLLGASAYGSRMIRLPMDQLGLGTERIEIEMAYDSKVVAQDLAVFFKDLV